MRRQGVRAEGLLKDSDNLIQRYRNLSVRLQDQAEAQSLLQGECDMFNSQVDSTRAWMTELLKPLIGPEDQPEERTYRAQVSQGLSNSVFSTLREGFSPNLRMTCSSQLFRDLRNWPATIVVFFSCWCLQFTYCLIWRFSVLKKSVLSSKEEGDYRMDDLKRQGEHLCEQEALEKVQKQKIQQSVGVVEEQWRSLLQTAEEVLNEAQTEADAQKQFDGLKSQIENVQLWIKDQKKKLLSTSSHMQFAERIQVVKVRRNLRLNVPAGCFHVK